MFLTSIILVAVLEASIAEEANLPFHIEASKGVQSKGQVMYGNQDMTRLNEVVTDMEKNNPVKNKINLKEAITPLPARDVKCLMSVDLHCTKEMRKIKDVLVQALKNDCKTCSNEQKEGAGKVAASMMAHDPVAWKVFLTRCALQIQPEKKNIVDPVNIKIHQIGEPEIVNTKSRYALPGVKIRVKRYAAEKIP